MAEENGRYEKGTEALQQLMGRVRSTTLLPGEPPAAEGLHRIFIEHAYGDSWADPTLDMKTKSLVTLAILSTLGASSELQSHIRGAHNLGVSRDEVVALLTHVAAYSGVPRAVHALSMAREAWLQIDGEGN